MNRTLLRATLIGLILVVALGAAAPALLSAVGIKISVANPMPQKTSANYLDHACSAGSAGTTIVVDFGSISKREPLVRCAVGFGAGRPTTGWDLFAAAGIIVAGTTQYPTGFVCRIDGYPTAATQPCDATPTEAQGTWTYYYSDASTIQSGSADGAWKFRMQGAAQTKPSCGAWEGWRFVSPTDSGSQLPSITPHPLSCQY